MGGREGGQTRGASHVDPGRWGPGKRKGVGAQGLPAGRGPTNVMMTELAPGLADSVLSKTGLLQWASRAWVEGLLTFRKESS